MAGGMLKIGAVLIVLATPFDAFAAIGDLTGTSSPTIIVPQTTPAPQTPAYPSPPIGPVFIGPPVARFHHHHWRSPGRPGR